MSERIFVSAEIVIEFLIGRRHDPRDLIRFQSHASRVRILADWWHLQSLTIKELNEWNAWEQQIDRGDQTVRLGGSVRNGDSVSMLARYFHSVFQGAFITANRNNQTTRRNSEKTKKTEDIRIDETDAICREISELSSSPSLAVLSTDAVNV